jgi:hypothetical protein
MEESMQRQEQLAREQVELMRQRAAAEKTPAKRNIGSDGLITPNNLSKELLKDLLDGDSFDSEYDDDGDLGFEDEGKKFYVFPRNHSDGIKLVTYYRFDEELSMDDRLQIVNKINDAAFLVRAKVSKDVLRLDYAILLNEGLTKEAFISTVRKFCSIARKAARKHAWDSLV